mgnify:CR=1 FL=1
MIWLVDPLSFRIKCNIESLDELNTPIHVRHPYIILREHEAQDNSIRERELHKSVAHVDFDNYLAVIKVKRNECFKHYYFHLIIWEKHHNERTGESWLEKQEGYTHGHWLVIWDRFICAVNRLTNGKLLEGMKKEKTIWQLHDLRKYHIILW